MTQRSRRFFLAVAAIAVCLLVSIYAAGERGTTGPLSGAFGVVLTPLQKGVSSIAYFVSDKLAYFTRYDELQEENAQLKEQVLELEQKLRDFDRYTQENESLREFAGVIETQRDFEYEFAQVIARDPDNLFYTFTVDKGSVDGIKRYDAVITPDGLAGIVTEVGLTYSKVTSILDELTPIGAVVSRTRDLGLLESDSELREQGLCRINYLPSESSAAAGDTVETSGLGGVFPSGIVIGTVREVLPEQHNISSYAVVSPAVDFTNIRYCMVIKAFEEGEPTPGQSDDERQDSPQEEAS